jgi:hypothetical protein
MRITENPIESLLRELEEFLPKEQYINPQDDQWQVTMQAIRHDERHKIKEWIKEWNERNLKNNN